MKRNWQPEELVEHWTLLPDELALLVNKSNHNRLGFALLLKFFQLEARFPYYQHEVPQVVISQVAKQLGVIAEIYLKYDWNGRTIKRHRAQIRNIFGFREATAKDSQYIAQWLTGQVLGHEHDLEHLLAEVYQQFRQRQIEPPTPERVERLIHSAIYTYEQRFFAAVMQQLSASTRVRHPQQSWWLDECDRPKGGCTRGVLIVKN